MNKPITACRIGLAGCGAMGLPMLKQLIASGLDARGYDVRPLTDFGRFAVNMCADPAEFSADLDILISVVRDRAQTEDLCCTAQKIFEQDSYPRIFIISSTLSPQQFHEIAGLLPEDVIVIDAPMSGAPIAASEGNLTFMVGCETVHFDYLRPLFATMGETVNHVGAAGTGMAVKVLNNYVAACSVLAVRKVLDAARCQGLDQEQLLDIMRASSGATWFGDNFGRIDWARQGYESGNTIAILEKDVNCALQSLDSIDPLTSGFDRELLNGLRQMEPFRSNTGPETGTETGHEKRRDTAK